MKLKPTKAARLTLDTGETVMLEYLGKGMFHTCYVDASRTTVYSVTIERDLTHGDYSKEILSHPTLGCQSNIHIPPVKYLGDLDGADNRVYQMPFYTKLRATNKEAWHLYKRLQQARNDAWVSIVDEYVNVHPQKMRISGIGNMVNQRVAEMMDAPGVPEPLKEAINTLVDAASNYGTSYVFEFSPRNLMVDESGTLILLDVLFNLEAVEAIQSKKRR